MKLYTPNYVNNIKDETPLGFQFKSTTVHPSTMCLVPILRSGLGMVDGMLNLLSIRSPD